MPDAPDDGSTPEKLKISYQRAVDAAQEYYTANDTVSLAVWWAAEEDYLQAAHVESSTTTVIQLEFDVLKDQGLKLDFAALALHRAKQMAKYREEQHPELLTQMQNSWPATAPNKATVLNSRLN